MTNDKSGVWEIGENAGANAIADENPVHDYGKSPFASVLDSMGGQDYLPCQNGGKGQYHRVLIRASSTGYKPIVLGRVWLRGGQFL